MSKCGSGAISSSEYPTNQKEQDKLRTSEKDPKPQTLLVRFPILVQKKEIVEDEEVFRTMDPCFDHA